jgi:GntP family gluconate:H+ symporter
MLRNAGMADAIKAVALEYKINLLLLGYVVAVIIRIAQGSATVAMLTTSAMLYPLTIDAAGASSLPVHPMYLFLTIGFGAFSCSWMNDSGFWVVSRLGGLTEKETLKTWTVTLTVVSLVGFVVTMLLSTVLPFK